MKMLVIRLLVNAAALAAAAYIVPGIEVTDFWKLLIVAAIFGLVNAIIKPIVTILTCPLVALTLGLFTIVINALMLWLTGWISSELFSLGFTVDGFWAALWGSLIVSVVSIVLSIFLPDN